MLYREDWLPSSPLVRHSSRTFLVPTSQQRDTQLLVSGDSGIKKPGHLIELFTDLLTKSEFNKYSLPGYEFIFRFYHWCVSKFLIDEKSLYYK